MKGIWLMMLLLPALSFAQSAPAYRESEVIAALDRFILSQRENYHAYEDMLEEVSQEPDSVRFDTYRNDAFVKALRQFYIDNADAYSQLRYGRFVMYAAPPPALLRLNWDTAGVQRDMAELEGNYDMLSPAFFRVFEPYTIAQTLTGFMTMSAYEGHSSGMKSHYMARDRYGMRLYTKRITPSQWQVWAADRSMAITFIFHSNTGIVQPIARTTIGDPAYARINWPPSPVHFYEKSDELSSLVFTELWKSYRPADTLETAGFRERRRAIFQNFRTKHAIQYQAAIRQQLVRLEPPPAMPAGYRERTKREDNMLAYSDSVMNAAVNLTPAQWASALEAAAFPYLDMHKNVLKVILRNAYFPVQQYARQLNEGEWDVMIVQEVSAMRFTWNIATGMVRDARYYLKEEF